MGDAAGYNREVCIDELTFDDSGNIIQVSPTLIGIEIDTTTTPPTGTILNQKAGASLNINPNPVKNTLNISINEPDSPNGIASIYDPMGRLVQKLEIEGNAQVNTSKYSSGLYIIKYSIGNYITGTCSFLVQ
jgi:hypothetical protein